MLPSTHSAWWLSLGLLFVGTSCSEITYVGSGGGGAVVSGGAASSGGGMIGGGGVGGGAGGTASCEGVDFAEDPAHCGSCGHDCAGGDCDAGVCQPVEIWASSADPKSRFSWGITIAEDQVVWLSDEGTLALPLAAPPGTEPTVISPVPGVRILYEAPTLYRTWSKLITTPLTGGDDQIWGSGMCNRDLTRDSDGNTFCVESAQSGKLIGYDDSLDAFWSYGGLSPAFGVAVTDSDVYVGTESGLLRISKSFPGAPQTLHPHPSTAQILKVDSKLYFGSSVGLGGGSLMAYDLVTEEVSEVLADVSPGSIHADESHLYFSEWGKQTLWRVSLDGKSTFTWAVVPPFADVLAGNEQFLFFTTDLDGRLYRLRK